MVLLHVLSCIFMFRHYYPLNFCTIYTYVVNADYAWLLVITVKVGIHSWSTDKNHRSCVSRELDSVGYYVSVALTHGQA